MSCEPNQEQQSSGVLNWQKFWSYRVPILFFSFGIIFLFVAIFLFYKEKTSGQSVIISQTPNSSNPSNPLVPKLIKVDVSGAVVNPGVYELSSWARIQDALIKAGGLAQEADRDWTAKNLNLAQKLLDGTKIYIPFKDENPSSSSPSLSALININNASESQLDTLSGVGPATAQKIISGRPYESIDDLLNKKIVGKSVFEKIKDKISVY